MKRLGESEKNADTGNREQLSWEQSFEQAFESTGHGKFNRLVLLTSGLIMLNVSMESVGMSYVVPVAACDLHLTNEHKGLITASAFIANTKRRAEPVDGAAHTDNYLSLDKCHYVLTIFGAVKVHVDEKARSTRSAAAAGPRRSGPRPCSGIMCTSFLWGYLGDRCGRRAVMLPALLASAVLSVASAFSVNVWMLIILRVLTGCLVSASSATVYAYLGELHTAARRAAAIAWGSAFISFSFMILPGLAWLIIPGTWSWNVVGFELVPWRVFVLCWCLPGLMAAALLLILPESPKFIIALRGPREALPVLARMYSWNYNTSPNNFIVKKLSENPSSEINFRAFSSALKNFGLLFRPPLLRCVVISHVSMFAVFMLSSGLYMWTPDILNNLLRNPDSRHLSICDVIHSNLEVAHNTSIDSGDDCTVQVSVALFPISMGMGAVFALTYLAIGFFINKIGKKTLYCGIMLCCGALTAAGGLVPSATAATVLLVLALCSGCAASILAAITVDVFPTSLRAMSMCVMYMVGRAGAAAGASALGRVLDTHCRLAFCVFGAITAGSTFLMLLWPKPERIRQRMEKKGLTY